MEIYWSLKSVPELRELDRKTRTRVWRKCVWYTLLHWQMWIAGAMGAIAGASLALLAQAIEQKLFGQRSLTSLLVCGGPAALLFGLLVLALRPLEIHFARPYIRRYREQTATTAGPPPS